MTEKAPQFKRGEKVWAKQKEDGEVELYDTLDEIVKDSESDETVYELFVYRQIDIKQAA